MTLPTAINTNGPNSRNNMYSPLDGIYKAMSFDPAVSVGAASNLSTGQELTTQLKWVANNGIPTTIAVLNGASAPSGVFTLCQLALYDKTGQLIAASDIDISPLFSIANSVVEAPITQWVAGPQTIAFGDIVAVGLIQAFTGGAGVSFLRISAGSPGYANVAAGALPRLAVGSGLSAPAASYSGFTRALPNMWAGLR